jgi:hypothetical protein
MRLPDVNHYATDRDKQKCQVRYFGLFFQDKSTENNRMINVKNRGGL